MKSQAKRIYYSLLAMIGLAVVVLAASVYLAVDMLQKKSEAVAKAKLDTLVLEETQTILRRAKADAAKYRDLAKIARSIVPQDKDQAKTVREIANLAKENGVTLGSITFPSSELGTKPDSKQTQVKPVTNIPGVYTLPITVRSDSKVSSPFKSLIRFLDALEHNRRTALVTSISIQPDTRIAGNVTFTLTVEEYIKP